MQNNPIEYLKETLTKYQKWFSKGSVEWSFIYHFCLFGAGILSLIVSFLVQLKFFDGFFGLTKDDTISLIALISATLSMIIAKGGLSLKWKSNRISRGEINGLILDFHGENPDYEKIRTELKKIIITHDLTIVNSSIETKNDTDINTDIGKDKSKK